jgi:hypothetical protein
LLFIFVACFVAKQESDIDVFLFGLTPQQANQKLRDIHKHLTQKSPVLIVRTNNAVTFACDFPRRHVQVILRLYKSPAEILMVSFFHIFPSQLRTHTRKRASIWIVAPLASMERKFWFSLAL